MMIAVGSDISQKTIDVQILDENETYIKIQNNEIGFNKLLKKLSDNPCNYHFCMEATGNYYENFADFLVENGFQVTVANPLKISKFAETEFQKTKTDKQDCKLIAQYCQEKLLKKHGTYKKPTEQQYQVKRLLSYINQLKQQKIALMNRQKNCKDEFIEIELKKQLVELKAHIKTAESKLSELTKSEEKDRLKTIPAISETTARVLVHFLTMFDFKTANKFTAFAGLSPQQRKSGTSVNKKEKLSRYGNRILKTALYMPAVVAYRMGVFKKMTDRLEKKGKSGKVVIVAIMRKLAVLAFNLYKKGQVYDIRKFG